MGFFQSVLGLVAGLAVLQTAYAKLNLSSNSTVAVYWGQNSFQGSGELAQQRLAYYCNDDNIDVLILAFVTRVNGQGGVPEVNFSNAGDKCSTFEGTNLLHCPQIGQDITTCQKKNKTIILSIGGATYSEGGFASPADAQKAAELMWDTFGPPPSASSNNRAAAAIHRPFGDAVVDGFDFDFEATVTNMAPFANRLRALANADKSKRYYLTAAPQCPYPDAADKDILNGPVSIDAVWVQFYNNYCGINAFTPGAKEQNNFNFDTWDQWAKTVSENKKVKVFLGVPANTRAAGTGYLPIGKLDPVIAYSQDFASFGGVMMWDVTQAYGNPGFLDGVSDALGRSNSHLPQEPVEETSTTTSTITDAPTTTTATTADSTTSTDPATTSTDPAAHEPAQSPPTGTQDQTETHTQTHTETHTSTYIETYIETQSPSETQTQHTKSFTTTTQDPTPEPTPDPSPPQEPPQPAAPKHHILDAITHLLPNILHNPLAGIL